MELFIKKYIEPLVKRVLGCEWQEEFKSGPFISPHPGLKQSWSFYEFKASCLQPAIGLQ